MIRRPGLDRALFAILAASVLFRLAAAWWLGGDVTPLPGTYDQVTYDALAQRVAAGHGFTFASPSWPLTRADEPTAHWSFLYTGYLAAVYALAGHAPLLARAIQAVAVGILLPWGVYRLGDRLFGRRVGLWSAALAAGYAYFVYYAAALMTESLTIVAVVWMLGLVLDLADRPTARRWLAFGGLVGVAALLRQVTVLAVLPLGIWLAWRLRGPRALAGLAGAAMVAVVLVAPVTLRNYRAFDRLVPINTNAGYAFYWSNHPIHGTSFQGILPADGPSYQDLVPAELRALDEAAMNDALLRRGLALVRDDPVRYILLSVSRLEDYFKFWPSAESSGISNVSRVLSFGLLLPFMVAGLWLSRSRGRRCMPCYLFIVTYTAIHLLSWALIRYRLPVDAVLVVFAGLAVDTATVRIAGRAARAPIAMETI